MILTADVVTCFKDIISALRCILGILAQPGHEHVWTTSKQNPPEIFQIISPVRLNGYQRCCKFLRLSTGTLHWPSSCNYAVQRHRTEESLKRLCIPGLGTQRFADSSWTLMDFLPCLIPGTLSLHVNATLTVVRNESNNGYNYLSRVLELTVPGFNPVIPIQTLQWLDCDDIFQPPVFFPSSKDALSLH
jgi:hypothetical protein